MVMLCAGCPSTTALPDPPTAPTVGFSPGADLLWMAPTDQARELDTMAAAGATWIRLDVPWPSVEPAPGSWNWGPFDRTVAAARARGLKVLGLLSYAPRWASRPPAAGVAPFDVAAFAAYAGGAARHFSSSQVDHWEVWNEENLAQSWGATPDPSAYAAVLRAASAAIRRSRPGARIVSGGLAPATDAPDHSEIAPLTFATAMYASGARNSFDALGVHPYAFPAMPTDASTSRWNTFLGMSRLRSLMISRGDAGKQIWLTEMGAPTGTASGALTEANQLRYVTGTMAGWVARPWAGPILWYSVRDRSDDRSVREDNFGLLHHNFTPKPAYGAFVSAVKRLGRGRRS